MPDSLEQREILTPPNPETQKQLSELVKTVFEGFKKLFEGTELASFFDMFTGEVDQAIASKESPEEISKLINDPEVLRRYSQADVGELFLQNERTRGFFGMLFLVNDKNLRGRHPYSVGETFRCEFLGNKKAEHEVGLADIIADNQVAVIAVTHEGKTTLGRRVIDGGKMFYAKCDDKGIPLSPKTSVPVYSGDQIEIRQRMSVTPEFSKYADQYYKNRAVELRNPDGNYSRDLETRDGKQYEGMPGSVQKALAAWRIQKQSDPNWGVACYRIARRICRQLNGLDIVGGTPPTIDYKSQGVWPKLDGTHAERLARAKMVPVGTAFHMSVSGDYSSMRGSNHWFTLTGYDNAGEPLFADQGGVTRKIGQIYGVHRPLLAVYYKK